MHCRLQGKMSVNPVETLVFTAVSETPGPGGMLMAHNRSLGSHCHPTPETLLSQECHLSCLFPSPFQPERINPELNQKGYSVKSDIWSLGITMVVCDNNCGLGGRGCWGMKPRWGKPREQEVDALEADLREQDSLQSRGGRNTELELGKPSSLHSTSKELCALE